MPINISEDSATIGSTEYSIIADTTSGVPVAHTDDCVLQVLIDFVNMTAGDTFEVKGYEKVLAANPARVIYHATFVGVQTGPFISPALVVGAGYDWTVKKVGGNDRTIPWSIRKVT